MCGRYLITSAPEAFRRLFGYRGEASFPPRYNVAPTQPVPIVRLLEGERQLAPVRWGLIPHDCKDPEGGRKPINARAESWRGCQPSARPTQSAAASCLSIVSSNGMRSKARGQSSPLL